LSRGEEVNVNERRLVVISGAGLSAESGLATFRDASGIWSQYNLAEVCSYPVWRRNRTKVFDFYSKRKDEVLAAQPNPAHHSLAQWQRQWGEERVQLLTQNVDDLLERAGAARVTHLHGELTTLLCDSCYRKFDIGNGPIDPTLACPRCHEVESVKPGVVMFGETSPGYHQLWDAVDGVELEDILLVIGTSMQVIPVERLVPQWRKGSGLNWQVNPLPAAAEHFGWNIAASATEGLPQLEPLLTQLMSA
jgi:NAD-dependent deacetylase